MAATNINRVVLTGNLTRDPELRSTPSGTSVCSLRLAFNTRRKDAHGRVGGQAQLLRRHRLGRAGRELRPVPAPRAARSRSTAASSGASGRTRSGNKRQAVDIIADSVQFLGGRDDGGNGNGGGSRFTPQSDVPADTGDFQPAGAARARDDDIPF